MDADLITVPAHAPQSQDGPGRRRSVALAVAAVATLALLAGGWLALHRQPTPSPAPWTSARDMATAIGCQATFQVTPAGAGLPSHGAAGTCQVLGSPVVLVTSDDNQSLNAWYARYRSVQWHHRAGVSVLGDRYVAFSPIHDVAIMQALAPLSERG